MPRRSILLPGSRDGTSRRSRRLPALDPAHALIDERTDVDVLKFVQWYATQLRFVEAEPATGELRADQSWEAFANSGVSPDEMAAYLEDPERFAGEAADWLGRPHFALLLVFVKLLGHAREQLNGFTRRHLDYFYRELLAMRPEPPVADRATVIVGLRPRADEARLPAGTRLSAGKDADNVPRIYLTERDLVVNRASVASLRSVFVDRRFTGIPDVREDRSLTAPEAFTATLELALGSPAPGDEIPRWGDERIDVEFIRSLREPLDFAPSRLHLEHHELRTLVDRLTSRIDGASEAEGAAERLASVGPLDFTDDRLPQVDSLDDLYLHRDDPTDADDEDGPDVRAFIEDRFGAAGISFDEFEKLMEIKRHADAEWAVINRLLEKIGRTRLGVLEWSLAGDDPTDFETNLKDALGEEWPPPWPEGTGGIEDYSELLRNLEDHLSMPVERLQRLVEVADELVEPTVSDDDVDPRANEGWSDVDRILADAHREKVYAERRKQLEDVRGGRDDAAAFDAVASFVLGEPEPIAWEDARPRLEPHLEISKLERFRQALEEDTEMVEFGWPDAERLFELGWRGVTHFPDPVAEKAEVYNVYAHEDATGVTPGTAPGWRTFGTRPLEVNEREPQGATLGWALRSPLLALSEGERTITLTLGLAAESFDAPGFLEALGLSASERSGEGFARFLAGPRGGALVVEVSTADKWSEVGLSDAELVVDEERPALRLTMRIGKQHEPLAPLEGEGQAWPTLRLSLRRRWDPDSEQWRTAAEAFEPLVVSSVRLHVAVNGLSSLRLQHEDRLLDSGKPFEPFGSRPAVGSRLYIDHPELVRARLGQLQFHVKWMGVPESLNGGRFSSHYDGYPPSIKDGPFTAQIALVDNHFEIELGEPGVLVDDTGDNPLDIEDVGEAIERERPQFVYAGRPDLVPPKDLRLSGRYFRWELATDFGHGIYPALALQRARAVTNPPYTPTIKRLTVDYTASIEIDPSAPAGDHQVLHVHPFGACPIDTDLPSLLPRYPMAGELYIGVRDLRPPQHLTLHFQLAEGTSDPDMAPAALAWSYLDGDRFVDLSDGAVVHDSTRGLLNSGIVELALPPAVPSSGRLPSDLYWLRAAIPRSPRSVCDSIAVRAQAVSVRFEDEGNAPAHYETPLPPGTIKRLVEPDPRIASVEQPYSSFGGRPAERAEAFDTRVSERLRHKRRALSAWDYERLVLHRFPQIYQAKCFAAGDGGVDVVVIPDVRALYPSETLAPKAPANLLADIQAYLAERAPPTARVRARNPRYRAVQVRLGVRFRPGLDEAYARKRLNQDLIRFLSPWAFNEGADVTFGGRIYANSILDFVDRRDDVDFVAEIKLFRRDNGGAPVLVPPETEGYHVATDGPDQVLVADPEHFFDPIAETGFQPENFTGIGYMRIELDFTVG